MSKPKIREGSDLFSDVSQKVCACGCGSTFLISGKGKKRLYLNDTHKKRAARKLKKERQTETRHRLTPVGWLYLATKDSEMAWKLWEQFTPLEREIIWFICESDHHFTETIGAMWNLFGEQALWPTELVS